MPSNTHLIRVYNLYTRSNRRVSFTPSSVTTLVGNCRRDTSKDAFIRTVCRQVLFNGGTFGRLFHTLRTNRAPVLFRYSTNGSHANITTVLVLLTLNTSSRAVYTSCRHAGLYHGTRVSTILTRRTRRVTTGPTYQVHCCHGTNISPTATPFILHAVHTGCNDTRGCLRTRCNLAPTHLVQLHEVCLRWAKAKATSNTSAIPIFYAGYSTKRNFPLSGQTVISCCG